MGYLVDSRRKKITFSRENFQNLAFRHRKRFAGNRFSLPGEMPGQNDILYRSAGHQGGVPRTFWKTLA
jgi:hypothetical protein